MSLQDHGQTAVDPPVWEVGIESEGFGVNYVGQPLHIASYFPALSANKDLKGWFAKEVGPGTFELVGKHEPNLKDACDNVQGLYRALMEQGRQDGISFEFIPVSPFASDDFTPYNQSARFVALWEACQREVERLHGANCTDWQLLGRLNFRAALQFHGSLVHDQAIRVDGIDPKVIFVMNVVNLYAPRLAAIICRRLRLKSQGHLAIWRAWADPRRFPQFGNWYRNFEHLKESFEALPRLIKPVDGSKYGGFEVDLVDHLRWDQALDHGAGWWPLVRPRPHMGKGTLEFRLLPAVPPDLMHAALDPVVKFITLLFRLAPENPPQTLAQFVDSSTHCAITREKFFGERLPHDYYERDWKNDFFGRSF